jgi:hypothetical protein
MKAGLRDMVFVAVALGGTGTLAARLFSPLEIWEARHASTAKVTISDLGQIVHRVDTAFQTRWSGQGLAPAARAPELAVMRRLALALAGTVPALQEIRNFELAPAGQRIEGWLDALLHDRRCADNLAERLARVFVGTEDGPFLRFRRRRFVAWLSDAILENRRYDDVVKDLIAGTGVWTDHPEVNFLTVTIAEDTERPTPDRLAARVARAFLGVRLDCAQCHDHPFQPWKQSDFRGLAAFFGGVHSDLRGIRDAANDYRPADRNTREPGLVEPRVPFCSELRPSAGVPREQLAAWVTDSRNPNLARVTVNRIWAILFGRPLAEPVDDLPAAADLHPALIALAEDFASHRYDVHRLIRVIGATEVFRLDSALQNASEAHQTAWAVFPMTRLRPDQVAGALFQTASLTTIDSQSHWFSRLVLFTGRNDFVRRYGDTGEDEFDARAGTIPQRLLLMNGEVVRDRIKNDLFNAPSRIAGLAPDDHSAVVAAYLAVLTRRPTADESAHFAARLAGTSGDARKDGLSDLYWTLLNSTEFSWNH